MKRASLFVGALVALGIAAWSVYQQPPTGRVEGVALTEREKRPIEGAQATLYSDGPDGEESYSVRTDAKGRFVFRSVRAGSYQLSVSSQRHRTKEQSVAVREAQTVRRDLALARSEPDLNVAEARQPVFTLAQTPFIPVQGYGAPGDALTVRVTRARLSDVLSQPGGEAALKQLGENWRAAPATLPAALAAVAQEPVGRSETRIARTDREGFFVQRLPLPAPKGRPGVYFAIAGHGGRTVCSWALVTGTALVVKTPPRGPTLAYVADLISGRPVASANVVPLAGGPGGVTDASGLTRIAGGGRLLVRRGDDEAVVMPALGRSETGQSFTVHAYTDRTIYRPGHTVHWKAIVRRRDPEDPYRYGVPSGQPATVTVHDARGGEVLKETKATNAAGTLSGSFEISPEAETGSFTIELEVAGTRHTQDVLVTAYRKPEFQASATAAKASYVRGETVEFSLDAKYYFGAPVAGAKVVWSLFREGDWEAGLFEPGAWEDLDDDEREQLRGSYYGEKVAGGEAVLDSNGRLHLSVPAEGKDGAPPVERFTLSASVTDAAGRSASVESAVRVASGRLILSVQPEGYVAAPGKPATVFIEARDLEGKPLASTSVSLLAEYETWDEKAQKSRRAPAAAPLTGTTGPDGRASLSLVVPRPGEVRLTASARDAEGRDVKGTGSLYAVSEEGADLGSDYRDLTLLTDKRRYNPGETARVLVSAARTGQSVLLTVEGDALREARVFPLRSRSTLLSLPIKPEWGPNVTLSACYVRDKQLVVSQAPLRVAMPERELQVTVTPEKESYEPGDRARFAITLTDSAGRPVASEFSLSVVDEAIYALRADDPKDLKKAFYPRRYNAVETRHSFEVTYLSAQTKGSPKIAPRRKFKDTAYWNPSLVTGPDGRASVEVVLPDNLTAWRATARVCSADTAVGYGASKLVVKKPFFVRLDAPRFLVGGDAARALALVHNDTGAPQSVTVELNGERKSASVASGAIGKVEFALKAPEAAASLPLTLKAWSADERWRDGVETRLPVRAFGRDVIAHRSGIGESGRAEFAIEIDPRAVRGTESLTIRVAPGVAPTLDDALSYLSEYPYGCIEQTTSRFWPHLLVARLRNQPVEAWRVRDGLTRLRASNDGESGWGWWSNDKEDAWLTGYALLGIAEAARSGWGAQSKELGLAGVAAGRKLLQKEPGAALLAYGLARAGSGDAAKAALLRLTPDAIKKASATELALWTLTARAVGFEPGEVWAECQRRAVADGAFYSWKAAPDEWDSSDVLATALGLKALLAMNPADARAERALRWLLTARTGESFSSTRDTAFTIAALCDWLALHPESAIAPPVALRVNGQSVPLQTRPGGMLLARVPATLLRPGANAVALSGGSGRLFWSAGLRQTIGKDPTGAIEPQVPDGVILARDFLPAEGNRPQARFKAGESVRVRLSITVPRAMEYVLIEDAFPGGFEPTERGTAESEPGESWDWWYSHVDVRDDRIAVFARSLPAGKYTFVYHLRAQTPGRYGALPATLAPMYRDGFQADSRGQSVEVTP